MGTNDFWWLIFMITMRQSSRHFLMGNVNKTKTQAHNKEQLLWSVLKTLRNGYNVSALICD